MSENKLCSESLTTDAAGAAKLIGIARTTFYALASTGKLCIKPLRFGRRVAYSCKEIHAYIDAGAPPCAKWHGTGNTLRPA